MDMHPRTVATLDELVKATWFASVGEKDTKAAIVLSSWQEAIEHCSSIEWENICLEAANQYRERLVERSVERFRLWNDIVDEVKKVTKPFVQRKVKKVVVENKLPPIFESTVHWDILHLCMEAEYADVYPPGFYAGHAYWYTKGHFPCGWDMNARDEQFPKGRPIIY